MHDEELRTCTVGVHSTCHRQYACSMFQVVFHAIVSEFTANGVAGTTHTCAIGAAALNHEASDDTMENQTIIEIVVYQRDKVVYCVRRDFGIQFRFDHAAVFHLKCYNRIFCHVIFLLSL